MPITLAKIANNTAPVSFSYDGEMVTITYYPGHVSENVVAELQSFATLDANNVVAGFKAFNESLVSLIQSWDVYEDEGQTTMFPIDTARFPELPIAFRMAVVGAIMADIRPETLAPQTAS